MTASQLEKLSHKYALVQRHGQDPHPLGDAQRRCVRRRDTEDGMVKIEAVLHPEEAELVWTMINHAATQLTREPAPSAIGDSAEAGAAAQGPRDAVPPSPSDAGDGRSGDSAEASKEREAASALGQSVLHQRADAAKRGFHRADALVSLAQGYLRGDRPELSDRGHGHDSTKRPARRHDRPHRGGRNEGDLRVRRGRAPAQL